MVWNETIDQFLQQHGFKSFTPEPCFYTYPNNGEQKSSKAKMLLFLHVDDILLAGQPDEI